MWKKFFSDVIKMKLFVGLTGGEIFIMELFFAKELLASLSHDLERMLFGQIRTAILNLIIN